MGMGDELLASGIAKRIHAMTNERVNILDATGRVRQHELWDGLPYVAQDGTGRAFIVNGPSARPYYSGMQGNRIMYRKWDIAPGEIRLTDAERAWAKAQMERWNHRPFIFVEHKFKPNGGGGANKDWGREKWEALTQILSRDYFLVTTGPDEREYLPDTFIFHTPTFRHACAILERSIGYVGHEGGLHHAAAALGKPAVVVFGGYISPAVTGYPGHVNLYSGDSRFPLGCGIVTPCEHCRESMSKITVEEVVAAVKEMVGG